MGPGTSFGVPSRARQHVVAHGESTIEPNRIPRAVRWIAPALLVLLATAPVQAQTQQDVDEARQQRDAAREDAVQVAGRIDALTGDADELAASLDLLQVTISALESRLATAKQAVESTNNATALVVGEIEVLKSHQSELRESLLNSVVEQYIEGHAVGQRNILTAEDPVGWSMRQGLFKLLTRDATSVQDQLRVVGSYLDDARAEAESLADNAAGEAAEVARLATEAAAAHEAEGKLLAKVSRRLERRLAEADTLESMDAQLSDEIRRGEAEIARRLALAQSKARERRAQDGAASDDTAGADGLDSGLSAKDIIARVGEIETVRGIEVHASVADRLRALIGAAEANGILLTGVGWRSTEYQIELRIQNCGSTDYLIFDAPSEACWPATARPASSRHEAGTAIDFMASGRAIVDPNSVAFQWLAANASTYGFYNLWSEPWHWSTDGR